MRLLLFDAKILLTLIIISLLILLIDSLALLNLPKSLCQHLTVPVQYGIYFSGKSVTKQWNVIINARFAAQESKALKKQLAELLIENSNLRKRLLEAGAMLDQKNGLSSDTYNLLPAKIVGMGRFLSLDKGSDDGITMGQAVVYKESFVGSVKTVSPRMSQVMLTSDPDSKIAVFSQNDAGKAKGILLGQFGSEVLMDKILHQEPVKIGDLVYSDGTEGKLPKGLVMGKITEVLDNQTQVFRQAKVTPVINIEDLDIVFVVRM